MKRKFLTLFLALFLALGLVACESSGNKQAENKPDNIETNEKTDDEKSKNNHEDEQDRVTSLEIIKVSEEKIDLTGYTKLDSFDFTSPNSKDYSVSIYSNVELDDSGNIMLDDGQNWKIIASTEDGDYLLYDDYVQLGKIDLFSTIDGKNENNIIAECSTTAGLNILEFHYNEKNKVFERTNPYSLSGNVNKLTNY